MKKMAFGIGSYASGLVMPSPMAFKSPSGYAGETPAALGMWVYT